MWPWMLQARLRIHSCIAPRILRDPSRALCQHWRLTHPSVAVFLFGVIAAPLRLSMVVVVVQVHRCSLLNPAPYIVAAALLSGPFPLEVVDELAEADTTFPCCVSLHFVRHPFTLLWCTSRWCCERSAQVLDEGSLVRGLKLSHVSYWSSLQEEVFVVNAGKSQPRVLGQLVVISCGCVPTGMDAWTRKT